MHTSLKQKFNILGWLLPTFFLAGVGLLLAINIFAAAAEDKEEKIVPPKMLADFEDQQAVKLNPNECEAKRAMVDGGHALEIVTQAEASWPGVLIEPRQGKWDLSPFDAVEMDISNPQDAAVRVLLSVNNPGAEGQKNNNTESVTVPPRAKAVLVVPFGMWHGTSGHNLDLKNIVSVKVLLDKPGRSHRFLVDNIRAVCFDRGEMQKIFADPFFKQLKPVFGRGINLGNALEAPKEGEWGVVLKELYFEKIAAAGFDTVRIPVRWSAHADQSPPYRIDAKFFDRVDWAIDQALKRHLIPVVNMHHYEEIFNEPDKHAERFIALWQQIAEHYKDYPPELAFELLNEPNKNLTAEKWNRIASEAIRIIRPSNPTRQIVVGPVGWNGIGDLPTLELPEDDRHLVATVHYYSPFQFTHQGAEWAGPEAQKWLGNKWTSTKKEQMAVMLDLDKAITWAVEHRRPMWLGEFGSYNKADMDSRARWTAFVADEALKRKMGFAYWEFCSGFGVFDPQKNQWIEPLKQALLDAGQSENKMDATPSG
ncbi:MAG: glycoside hydrolase family 5 protein [Thermoguttaceae bacterium]|jgi:endoglucanase